MFRQGIVIEQTEVGRAEFGTAGRQSPARRQKGHAAGRTAFHSKIRTIRGNAVRAKNVFLSVFLQDATLYGVRVVFAMFFLFNESD